MNKIDSHLNYPFHSHFVGVLNLRASDLKIVLANIKGCEILDEYDFTERSFDQYFFDSDAAGRFKHFVETETIISIEIKLVQRNGGIRWVSISHAIFPSNEVIEILMFDITDDKKRIEDLERINQQLDQFTYSISHDLKSPIQTLLGLINLSKTETTSITTLHGYIDLMKHRIQHLDSILADLTAMTFNEKSSIELNKVSFQQEIESIVTQYREATSPVNIQIEVKQTCHFVGDLKRLRIVLRNLISNSIKYYNPTQSISFIKIIVRVEEKLAFVEIEDNGIGIHSQYVDKIFNMFFRATDRSSGSGLGLYIVKSIVDKLNGQIAITSLPDIGTLCRVVIPNEQAIFVSKSENLLSLKQAS